MRTAVPLLLAAGLGLAGPVQFHGSVGVSAEQSWIETDSGRQSISDVRFTLNPTLSVFGLPINLDLLLSSQESSIRQALNKFRLYLRPENLLSLGMSRAGFLIPGFELGTCNPSWSELTLSGVSVTGAAIELAPWNFYIAGAGGRSQRAVEGSDTTDPAYRRMLYAGKLGYGRKDGTHFYLTYLYAGDDSGSVRRNWIVSRPDTALPPETTEVAKPQENRVIGAELNIDIIRDHWKIIGEATGSELTRDNRLPVLTADWLPDWVANTFKPRLSTQVDYAYRARSQWDVFDTRFYAGIRMLGPGYRSLGTSFARNDNLGWEVGLDRGFFNNQVSFTGTFARDRDNLIGSKLQTSRYQSYSVGLGEYFPSVPYAQASYSRSLQSGAATDQSDMVSFGTGYSFTTGSVTQAPSFSASWQAQQSSDSGGDHSSLDLDLEHSLSFSSPLTISVGLGWSTTSVDTSPEQLFRAELTPSYTLFGAWTNSLSVGGTFEKGGRRIDASFNSSFPVWKIANARVAIARGVYSGEDATFSEWRASAGLGVNW